MYYIKTSIGCIGFKSNNIREVYMPDITTYYCIFTDEEIKKCRNNFHIINEDLWNILLRRINYDCIYTKIINNEYVLVFDLNYVDVKSISFKIYAE